MKVVMTEFEIGTYAHFVELTMLHSEPQEPQKEKLMKISRASILALLMSSLIFTPTAINVTATKSLSDSPTIEIISWRKQSLPGHTTTHQGSD